jgi:hypothetical protein
MLSETVLRKHIPRRNNVAAEFKAMRRALSTRDAGVVMFFDATLAGANDNVNLSFMTALYATLFFSCGTGEDACPLWGIALHSSR